MCSSNIFQTNSMSVLLGGNIMCVSRLALLLGLLLCVGAQLSFAQHWSHGWYPGGKRELDSFGTSEVGISVCVNNLTNH